MIQTLTVISILLSSTLSMARDPRCDNKHNPPGFNRELFCDKKDDSNNYSSVYTECENFKGQKGVVGFDKNNKKVCCNNLINQKLAVAKIGAYDSAILRKRDKTISGYFDKLSKEKFSKTYLRLSAAEKMKIDKILVHDAGFTYLKQNEYYSVKKDYVRGISYNDRSKSCGYWTGYFGTPDIDGNIPIKAANRFQNFPLSTLFHATTKRNGKGESMCCKGY